MKAKKEIIVKRVTPSGNHSEKPFDDVKTAKEYMRGYSMDYTEMYIDGILSYKSAYFYMSVSKVKGE